MHFLLALVLSLPSLALAGVEQTISLEQRPKTFRFSVTIRSTEKAPIRFALTDKAQSLSVAGSSIERQSTGGRILGLSGPGQFQLTYEIPYTRGQRYYLTSQDKWTPVLMDGEKVEQTFAFQARMLPGYEAIDSATGNNEEELDLVLCDCRHYANSDNRLHVYLLKDDPELAKSVLGSLQAYLTKFEAAYGLYPYDRFSVVESEPEIGLAFPKMTWIGSQLLHFPFILRTSLPHELLHSWWGNGVFVDYAKGNWCEGLTTFGADYSLLSEEDKKLYRLKALTSYMDYAAGPNELPLAKFVSRGEDRSLQAIGYDKALMVFLMAEEKVGAPVFQRALKEFYGKYRFQKASFGDFFSVLSRESGQDFTAFARYWVEGTGILPAHFLQARFDGASDELRWSHVPGALAGLAGLPVETEVALTGESRLPLGLHVRADGSGLEWSAFPFSLRPVAYAVDRDFRLFRALSPEEKPLSFSEVFAAKELIVSSARADLASALREALPSTKIAAAPVKPDFTRAQVLLVTAEQVAKLPEVGAALERRGVALGASGFRLQGTDFDKSHSLLLELKVQNTLVVVLAPSESQPLSRWLQRWKHYGSKNYLVLNATAADLQGLWVDPYWQHL